MNLVESFRIAIRALAANKVRSALTMLGVIIGVAAVILLVSIGTGVQEQVTGSIEGLGSNLLFVFPGDYSESGGGGGGPGGPGMSIRKQFTLDDAQSLQVRLGADGIVVPVIQGATALKVGNKDWRTSISAGNEFAMEVFTATLSGGRFYNRAEVVSARRVILIGATVRDQLFPGQDPVGRTVSVDGQPFTVIGHFEAMGGSFSGDQDNTVYMPVTTAQQLLSSKDISSIIVKAINADDVELLKVRMQQILKPKFKDQFTVFTQQQTLGLLSTLLGTLTAMLAGLASISLLVGGIGIMNIMLVSVSERTREIGIRKAVGARTYDILSQFVIEAIVLSVLGGATGILVGAGGALLLKPIVPAVVTPWAVVLAFVFSAAVGVFFGVYPAFRASRLDPIEALRYE
ncbi:MAG: FtsX-like permease family protein [Coriobacteriia bacterium]|nr:FtsX-like permease family protein [Coriobacteriia bacterium]